MSERNFNNFFLSKTFLKNSGKPTARDLERIKEYIERSINIAVGNSGIDNTTYGKTLKARFRDSIKRINQFEKRSEKLNVSVRKLGGTDTKFLIQAHSVMYLPTLETGRGPNSNVLSDEVKNTIQREGSKFLGRKIYRIKQKTDNGRFLLRRGALTEKIYTNASNWGGDFSQSLDVRQSKVLEDKPFVAWDDSRDPKSRIRRWIRKNKIKLKYKGYKRREIYLDRTERSHRKLKGVSYTNERLNRLRKNRREQEEMKLAYIIARSIRKKGTKLYQKGKGKRVRKVYSHILPLFNEQLNKRLASALQAYYNSYIQQYLYNSINTQEFN